MDICKRIAVLLLVAGCAACDETPETPEAQHSSQPAMPVALWRAAETTIDDRIESLATLGADESVALTARVSGKVSAVHFEDGDKVAAGQLLVELDDTEPAARVREVEATLREKRLQLERLGALGEDISTRAAIDIARAELAAEEARLAQANAILADHRLRAPFAGTLGFRQVSVGALVTPGTLVAELDAIDRLKMDFTVPEVYLSRLKEGDQVLARSPAWPEETFSAVVRNIGSRVDPVTRAVTVRGVLDNGDHRLRPGMLMTVELVVGQLRSLVLPERALIQKGSDSYVFSVDGDSRAYRVSVDVAGRVAGGVVIEGGLSPGQPVVVRGQLNLQPGTPVREVLTGSGRKEGAAE